MRITVTTAAALALTACLGALATPLHADATPECNNGPGPLSTECGSGSTTTNSGAGATAIGANSDASGAATTAVGVRAIAGVSGATALGGDAFAGGGGQATALGSRTQASTSATAAGYNAWAIADRSVALGANSVASAENTVSVGSDGSFGTTAFTRRIVNASDGVAASDVATVGQMNVANALQNSRITALEAVMGTSGTRLSSLESSLSQLDGRNELYNRQATGGIAAAMAMGGTIIPADANGAISFNLATFRGEQGFSAVVVQRLGHKVYANIGVAGSTVKGSTGGRAGVTIGW